MGKIIPSNDRVIVELSAEEFLKQTVKLVYKYLNLNEPGPEVLEIMDLEIKTIVEQSIWRVALEKKPKLELNYHHANIKLKEDAITIEYHR